MFNPKVREGVVIFLDKVNVHLISVGRPCSAGIRAMFSTDPVCSLGQNNLLVIGQTRYYDILAVQKNESMERYIHLKAHRSLENSKLHIGWFLFLQECREGNRY